MANTGMMMPGMEDFRRNWGWLLTLGIALFILGLLALSMTFTSTLAAVYVLGLLLVIAGVFEISNAFHRIGHGGLWFHLFTGVLDIVTGFLLIAFPMAGAAALTMILAVFFLVGGLVRIFGSLMTKLPNRGWAVLSGVVDFILGIVLLASWPVSALWFLGMVVGIGLIFRGIWWAMFAISARHTLDGKGETRAAM